MPQLWIVAGPNGAGKTTLADEYLAGIVPVVSPDSIAVSQGLNPIQAGKAAILEQERLFVLDNSAEKPRLLFSTEHGRVRHLSSRLPGWVKLAVPQKLLGRSRGVGL